jgi:glutamate-5-semialdehyde dehydrogenase
MTTADVAAISQEVTVVNLARAAKEASRKASSLSTAAKDSALEKISVALERHFDAILVANDEDVRRGKALVASGELANALFQRLMLNEEKLRTMIAGVRAVRELPDPSGRILRRTLLDDGLILEKVSCPLGLLAIIFEGRPDAITQISSLAIKSGNGVILKCGKEVESTMEAVLVAIHDGLRESSLPEAIVSAVYGRDAVHTLLKLDDVIDLVIPRGSNALVQAIQKNTLIPVLGHADGVCHVYIDAEADLAMAIPVTVDSKTQYPAVCNAAETILIHEAVAAMFLPPLAAALRAKGVKLRGDARTQALLPGELVELVQDSEWHTEYSDLIVAVRIVDSVEAAIQHTNRYGSHHTDSILTENAEAAKRFLEEVDSATVCHNCSTRFADGFRFGFGAEVGISTSKLHARGPVGLDGLVTYKYTLRGSGHIVKNYAGFNPRPFLHEDLDL